MLEGGGAVHIVQFFSLIYDGLDVLAAHEGDLPDYIPEFILLWSQIEMCDVTCSLETVGVGNARTAFLESLEAVEQFLVGYIFVA